MFWIKNPNKVKVVSPTIYNFPPPRKKDYLFIESFLNDIEKYDSKNEIDVRNKLIDVLVNRLVNLKSKK
jgi:hypothetical protein